MPIFFYKATARGVPSPVKLSEEPDGHYAKSAYAGMIDNTKVILSEADQGLSLDDLAKRYPIRS